MKNEEPSIFGVLIHVKLTLGSINLFTGYIVIILVSKKFSEKVFIYSENATTSINKHSQRHIY